MGETTMSGERIAAERRRDEAVNVGQVGGNDQPRHGPGREALETHAPKDRADE